MSSVKVEDVNGEYADLGEKEQTTLEEWVRFFSKRYSVVGVVKG